LITEQRQAVPATLTLLHPQRLLFAGFMLLVLFGQALHAEDKLPLDTVILMDSSGSMKQTDPRQLRKPAAKLFISLLGQQDRLSVVSFSAKAWPITFLTQLENEKQTQKALRATDRISHKGMYTNIHAALSKGIELLKQSDQLERDPIIILMSDGQMDVGNTERSAELRQQIFETLLPQLIEHNIKVYSIAFTQASDQQLLQEIADTTEGRYALAASDDVLHKVFSKIFEQTKQPDMLPLHENKFVVDASINEITIIANKFSDASQIYLQPPTGEKFNSTFKSAKVKWFVSNSFDMITIQKPAEGEWKILFSDDDNRAYIITDIKLRTNFSFNTESDVPELIIKSWFEQNEKTEDSKDLIKNMKVVLEIEHPDDTLETFKVNNVNEQGEFIIHYKPDANGIYGASIIATSRTFQRQQTFSFKNTLPDRPKPAPAPAPVDVSVDVSADVSTQPAAQSQPTPETEPTTTDETEKDENDLTTTLIYFGVANVILIFLGLNGFLIYRHLKHRKTPAAEPKAQPPEA